MKLIKGKFAEDGVVQSQGYSYHMAWIELFTDIEIQAAVLTANINILRRTAPYAYLFCNNFTIDSWMAEDIGDGADYRASLESKQLKVGIWLSSLSHSVAVMTVVTAVLSGDVLPFVHLLGSDEFALLCLPYQLTLDEIDEIVSNSKSGDQAAQKLVFSGGFIVTMIDAVRLKVFAADGWYNHQ